MHPSVCSLTVVYLIMNTLFIEILRIADNFLVENIIFAYTKTTACSGYWPFSFRLGKYFFHHLWSEVSAI